MVHDDYKEMISAHALAALDAREERALNEHLASCVECRHDLAEWEAVAASLALSAAAVEPSRKVREQILLRVQREPRKAASNVLPLPRRERNLWHSLGSLGSIAAIIVFVALLVAVVVLWQQNRALREQNETFQLLTAPDTRVAQLSAPRRHQPRPPNSRTIKTAAQF